VNKSELQSKLKEQYQQFMDLINGLTEEQLMAAPEGKWNPGQHLSHLIRSLSPLNKVMSSREVVLSFGKAENPSRNYDDVVAFYLGALSKGGKASGQFLPHEISTDQRKEFTDKLVSKAELLANQLNDYSEQDLDELVIPHPLLGNLTLREMMYFTIYHVSHHEMGIRRVLDSY